MDSDPKLQFLAAATFLGGHSLIATLYRYYIRRLKLSVHRRTKIKKKENSLSYSGAQKKIKMTRFMK